MRATDAALLIVALCVGWSLYRAHRSNNADFANFNLLDLLLENGRVSRIACVFLGSFLVTAWIMVRLTLDGKMTEGYLTSFGALWIIPLTAKLFSPPQTTSVTSVTATNTTTKPSDPEVTLPGLTK